MCATSRGRLTHRELGWLGSHAGSTVAYVWEPRTASLRPVPRSTGALDFFWSGPAPGVTEYNVARRTTTIIAGGRSDRVVQGVAHVAEGPRGLVAAAASGSGSPEFGGPSVVSFADLSRRAVGPGNVGTPKVIALDDGSAAIVVGAGIDTCRVNPATAVEHDGVFSVKSFPPVTRGAHYAVVDLRGGFQPQVTVAAVPDTCGDGTTVPETFALPDLRPLGRPGSRARWEGDGMIVTWSGALTYHSGQIDDVAGDLTAGASTLPDATAVAVAPAGHY